MLASGQRLPLFPLNTVLFPGMTLPLRIFEPRYRQMLADCLDGDQLFGVVLIKQGLKVGGPADPYSIGTTAHILGVEKKTEDLFNITTLGGERFRVLRLQDDGSYLVGEVEPFPLAAVDAPEAEALTERGIALLTAYLELLSKATGAEIQLQRSPEEPAAVAYLIAMLLQVALPVKQRLLSVADLPSLLREEATVLGSEVKALSVMAQVLEAGGLPDDADLPFSKN